MPGATPQVAPVAAVAAHQELAAPPPPITSLVTVGRGQLDLIQCCELAVGAEVQSQAVRPVRVMPVAEMVVLAPAETAARGQRILALAAAAGPGRVLRDPVEPVDRE